jgi:predicted MPP superfamily phosphohydrolase
MVQKGTSFTMEVDLNGKGAGGEQPDIYTNATYPHGYWLIYLKSSNDPWNSLSPTVQVTGARRDQVSDRWPTGSGPWAGKKVWKVTVLVPANTRADLYDLQVQVLLADGATWAPASPDVQKHSVDVVNSFKDNYNFVQLSDFHVNDPRGPGDLFGIVPGPHPNWTEFDPPNGSGSAPYYRYNQKAIDNVNNMNPDFAVITGDLVFGCPTYTESPFPETGVHNYFGDQGTWQGEYYWAYQQLLRLKVPVICVPGNHDLYLIHDNQSPYQDQDGKEIWPTVWGPLFYGWDYGTKCHFTNFDSFDRTDANRKFWEDPILHYWWPNTNDLGNIQDAQLTWVESDLAAASGSAFRIVANHHPFYNSGTFDDESNRTQFYTPTMLERALQAILITMRYTTTEVLPISIRPRLHSGPRVSRGSVESR